MSVVVRHLYQFGEFTVDSDQRVVFRNGKPLPLTPKVFDTLAVLVENGGRIVRKEELMNRLWPDSFVEEANLTFNIQQLRKSLGDNARKPLYIETVARRGYRFIATLEEISSDQPELTATDTQQITTLAPSPSADANQSTGVVAAGELSQPARALDSTVTAVRKATGQHKRIWALILALVAMLLAIGLPLWKFATVANRRLRERQLLADKPSSQALLKLEKLTQTGECRLVTISPDGKYIAYTRANDQKPSIWLRQLATNTNVEIVSEVGPYPIYGLAFSYNGEYVYFVRGDPTVLYRVSLLGGVPTKIVDALEGTFAISFDDQRIAFVRKIVAADGQRQYSLITANADGSNEHLLLAESYPNKLDAPVWAPDGQTIICAYGNSEGGSQRVSIIQINAADGSKQDLSSERFFRVVKMAWLPHRRALLISARKNLGDNNQLWRLSYPGVELTQITDGVSSYLDLTVAANAEVGVASQATRASDIWIGPSHQPGNLKRITQAIDDFCWTPDGRLVYISTTSGNRDLWMMNADGNEQRQLTVNAATNGAPAVTPDHRYIVFSSNRTGALQIWRMNIDGTDQRQLTDGPSKDRPAVSPDGKWVFYNTTDDWHLWKVSIDGGEPVQLTTTPAYSPSVSPNGMMVVCISRSEPRRALSLVILSPVDGQLLKRLDSAEGSFSEHRVQWTPDSQALIYAVERNGPTVLIKQFLNKGRPEQITELDQDELFDFGYSKDGRFLGMTRGVWQHDIVLLNNLSRY
jgi:Tol biopolymer transport system component/DNA-binding winged helix-turn-helix (wHTH) protein